jgi:antitoxin ParD1/3/4
MRCPSGQRVIFKALCSFQFRIFELKLSQPKWDVTPMQLALPPEMEAFVQTQLRNGKYRNLLDLVLAAIKLLQQQDDIYQGRLLELQREAIVGLEASQQGRVVDGPTAMAQIRDDLHDRYQTPDA